MKKITRTIKRHKVDFYKVSMESEGVQTEFLCTQYLDSEPNQRFISDLKKSYGLPKETNLIYKSEVVEDKYQMRIEDFIAAAELVRTKRAANARPTFDSLPSMGSGPMTAEKLNQLNAERYGTKGA